MATHLRIALALAAGFGLGATGCGEDDPPPPPKSNRPKPAAAAAAGARGGSAMQAEALVAYKKVEEVVTPDEAKTIRHIFKSADFQPDPSGTTNRDPFRSYIITQVSVNAPGSTPEDASAKTEKCANKKIAAAGYSTHELHLIGVVSRGTIRFATFADTANVGWVVQRGDCIGSEHARVKLIGEAFVTLEYPGAPPTAADPNPHTDEREYQLYPKDLTSEMSSDGDDDSGLRRRPPAIDITPEPPEGAPPTAPGGKTQQ